MVEPAETLQSRLRDRFEDRDVEVVVTPQGEITLELSPDVWLDTCRKLRDEFGFEQLIDLCGVDYLSYGDAEWDTEGVSSEGFSRGVEGDGPGRFSWEERPEVELEQRYAVVIHLLSIQNNQRLRVRCRPADAAFPSVASLVEVWSSANWFEREAFDLYGIMFEGHSDLRRILTDYGFVGHPFRKDFPLVGNVEVRYDPEKRRVVYEPTETEPRVLVPRTIRDDSRYLGADGEEES